MSSSPPPSPSPSSSSSSLSLSGPQGSGAQLRSKQQRVEDGSHNRNNNTTNGESGGGNSNSSASSKPHAALPPPVEDTPAAETEIAALKRQLGEQSAVIAQLQQRLAAQREAFEIALSTLQQQQQQRAAQLTAAHYRHSSRGSGSGGGGGGGCSHRHRRHLHTDGHPDGFDDFTESDPSDCGADGGAVDGDEGGHALLQRTLARWEVQQERLSGKLVDSVRDALRPFLRWSSSVLVSAEMRSLLEGEAAARRALVREEERASGVGSGFGGGGGSGAAADDVARQGEEEEGEENQRTCDGDSGQQLCSSPPFPASLSSSVIAVGAAEIHRRMGTFASELAQRVRMLQSCEASAREVGVLRPREEEWASLARRFFYFIDTHAPVALLDSHPLQQQRLDDAEELWEDDLVRQNENEKENTNNDGDAVDGALVSEEEEGEEQRRRRCERADERIFIQDEHKKEMTYVSGGVLFHMKTLTPRPVCLRHFEIVFDEPFRSPAEIARLESLRVAPEAYEDSLHNVRVELWVRRGSFLVSREAKERQRRELIAARANSNEEGNGSSNNSNMQQSLDASGRDLDAALERWEAEEKERNKDAILTLALSDNDGEEGAPDAPEEGPAAANEKSEGWRCVHASTQPRVVKNATFILPAGHAVLDGGGAEYSVFIRVRNKKILNFTRRVIKRVIPSASAAAAEGEGEGGGNGENNNNGNKYTTEEEGDASRFFYSPTAYKRFDDGLAISGCRWNARTERHFYKLAPRNDDVFFGRVQYCLL